MTTDEKREAIRSYCEQRIEAIGRCECEHALDDDYFCHRCNTRMDDQKFVDDWYASISKEASEAVDHPAHYQGKYECIDEMRALFGAEAVKAFCRCNIWKYKFRADKKNGSEDLKKAEWYMEYLMKLEDM